MSGDTVLCWADVETTGLSADDHVIELAVVFTRWPDPNLTVVESAEWLVLPPDACVEQSIHGPRWTARHRPAARVHQIPVPGGKGAATAFSNRVLAAPKEVAIELCDMVAQVRREQKASRVVLISDCAVFEERHLRKLLAAAEESWPFHYSVWDTSFFLEALGVGDPQFPPHRVMGDVEGLLNACREALCLIHTGQWRPQEAKR